MKPLLNNPVDRNVIGNDNYKFYFNKIIASEGIEPQNDVITNVLL